MEHGGSALSMNAGLLSQFDKWNVFSRDLPTKWLLIGGAIDPPENIKVSKRRYRSADKSGHYLHGIIKDCGNIGDALLENQLALHNYVFDMQMTKSRAIEVIKDLFENCMYPKAIPVIYYTGHGEVGTGNWCFKDGQLGIEEIFPLLP